MTKLLSTTEFLIYVTLTNYGAVLGGVSLWAALFLLGLIAQRLERAFGVPTGWKVLLWAPSGILLYTVYTLVQAGPDADTPVGHYDLEKSIAYGLLLVSSILSLRSCFIIYRLLRKLAHDDPSTLRQGSGSSTKSKADYEA